MSFSNHFGIRHPVNVGLKGKGKLSYRKSHEDYETREACRWLSVPPAGLEPADDDVTAKAEKIS